MVLGQLGLLYKRMKLDPYLSHIFKNTTQLKRIDDLNGSRVETVKLPRRRQVKL